VGTRKTIQFSNLTVEIFNFEDKARYAFRGSLDDKVKQDEIPRADNLHVTFDLSGIDRVTSTGIREWIKLMNAFKTCTSLIFENCSILMVDQFNMVPESLGKALIDSFQAPYFNRSDKSERICLIKVDFHMPAISKNMAPDQFDEQTKTKLEFDALEESYFAFLQKQIKEGKTNG
jgi:hypothetical protein